MSLLLNDLRERRDDIERRIEALVEESRPLREQTSNIDRTKNALNAELAEVKLRLRVLTEAPSVSDHAVIRYLERKHGFCFEDIRSEMLTDTVVAAMRSGVESVKALGGTMVIKGMKVVTFAP